MLIVPLNFFKDLRTNYSSDVNTGELNDNWPERRQQFEIFQNQADIVMVGDSLVHAGHWEDMFPFYQLKIMVSQVTKLSYFKSVKPILNSSPNCAFLMVALMILKEYSK